MSACSNCREQTESQLAETERCHCIFIASNPKKQIITKKKMSFLISFLSDPALVCLLCAAVLLAVVYFSTGYKNSAFKLPPGPTPLPIIGNLHLVDLRRQDKSLMKVGKKNPNPDPHRF